MMRLRTAVLATALSLLGLNALANEAAIRKAVGERLPPSIKIDEVRPTGIAGLWGRGWFVLPNPVYGTGLGATYDQTFPPATRWADPQEKK